MKTTSTNSSTLKSVSRPPAWKIASASTPATSVPWAAASGAIACAIPPRKESPPAPSECVGRMRSRMREICHRKRAQMKMRKYQRTSRNWKVGRLIPTNQAPASEGPPPVPVGSEYQVAASSAMNCRHTSPTPTP